MRFERNNLLFLGLGASLVAAIAIVVFVAMHEAEKWEAFKAAHSCKVVQRTRGDVITSTGFGTMASGKTGMVTTTSTTPDKTAWACDDGITYWR